MFTNVYWSSNDIIASLFSFFYSFLFLICCFLLDPVLRQYDNLQHRSCQFLRTFTKGKSIICGSRSVIHTSVYMGDIAVKSSNIYTHSRSIMNFIFYSLSLYVRHVYELNLLDLDYAGVLKANIALSIQLLQLSC